MANKRVFWAVQAVCIVPMNDSGASLTEAHVVKGLQSAGITTNFELEQVFEMGQLSIYENIETIPDVEVTLEKVIDGHSLIYLMASPKGTGSISYGQNDRADVYLGIYADTADNAGGATPQGTVFCSGMYVSSVSYTIPVDGSATESVTLVGNDKTWGGSNMAGALGVGTDTPPSGVSRRENIVKASQVLPLDIDGVTTNASGGWGSDCHLQTITVSTDLGREEILELGAFEPYHRYVTFPVEVTSEFECIAVSGDMVSAQGSSTSNLSNHYIALVLGDSTKLDLGLQNKLQSVSYAGADTGGGNATITYSYSNFNDLVVTNANTNNP